MKKSIILLILSILTTFVFSQTITIDVNQVRSHVTLGVADFEKVFEEPDIEYFPRSTDCRYVIDAKAGTSTFYKNGKFVSEVKISFTEISPGEYLIVSEDTDSETHTLTIPTTILLNTNKSSKTFRYQYYDPLANETIVDVVMDFTIVLPS